MGRSSSERRRIRQIISVELIIGGDQGPAQLVARLREIRMVQFTFTDPSPRERWSL